MQKTTLLLMLLIIAAVSRLSAQITHETTYQGAAEASSVDNYGYKYYVTDYLNNSVAIYNEDHTAWKNIALPITTGQFLYDVAYVSSKVFNTDDLLELLMVYYEYKSLTDTTGYYAYTTEVVNENGQVLLTVPGGAYSFTFTDSNNKSKLVIYIYDYAASTYITSTEIFGLPDKASAISEFLPSSSNPFPNPTTGMIYFPLGNHPGQDPAEVIISDISGKEYSRLRAGNCSKPIQYEASGLPPGTYIYKVETHGKVFPAGRFIKK